EEFPSDAAVGGLEDAAARSAAGAIPGAQLKLPHSGEEDARIVGIHGQIGAAGVFVDLQDLLPRLPAVCGAEDSALRLCSVGVAERAGKDDIRIARIDEHAADAAGLLESHQSPRLASIERAIDTYSDGDVAADERLAGAGPDDVGVGRGDRERSDGGHRL